MTFRDTHDRLGKLERDNRWLKAGLGALTLAVAAVLAMGAATKKPKKLEVEELVVRSWKTGKAAIRLSSVRDKDPSHAGGGELTLYDPDGNEAGHLASTWTASGKLTMGSLSGLITIHGGPDAAFVRAWDDAYGGIYIRPRKVEIKRGAFEKGTWAVLGSVSTVDTVSGAVTTTKPNTMTLFDEAGLVIFQAP